MVVWFVVLAVLGRAAHRRAPRRAAGALADVRGGVRRRPPVHRVHRDGRGRPGRSPAPRRCTPTWATSAGRPIRRGLVRARLPGADPQLPRPGGADPATTRTAVANPFFLLAPGWARLPLVVLATVATVIASQAVISGAFSVSRQAVRLGYLPHLTVRHTSDARERPDLRARASTGCCSRACWCSWWCSGRRSSSPPPTASRSPAPCCITTTLFLMFAAIAWRWATWKLVARRRGVRRRRAHLPRRQPHQDRRRAAGCRCSSRRSSSP